MPIVRIRASGDIFFSEFSGMFSVGDIFNATQSVLKFVEQFLIRSAGGFKSGDDDIIESANSFDGQQFGAQSAQSSFGAVSDDGFSDFFRGKFQCVKDFFRLPHDFFQKTGG